VHVQTACSIKHVAEAQAHWRMFEREALLHALDDAWCDLLAQLDGLKSATNIRCGCRD